MTDKVSEMDIGSGRSAFVPLDEEVATYFGIATTDVDSNPVLRSREAHTRTVYSDPTDNTGTQVSVPRSEWMATPAISGGRGKGQKVKVPLGKQTTAGNERTVTIRVPHTATVFAIQNWVKREFTLNTPDYIVVESGRKYPVAVGTATDVNPGNEPTANP